MSRPQHQRKQVYVSRAIQGRIVSKLAMYWATYHLALWHGMFLFHYFLYRSQLMADPQMATIPFGTQYSQFMSQNYSMLMCAAAVFPLIFWDMMKVTHRVAGPLVRFAHTLSELKQGKKVRPVTLREGDMLTEFRDDFNEYLEAAGLLLDDDTAAEQRDADVLTELRDLSEDVAETNISSEESEDLQPAGAGS
ncbi:MAG: hypothetical protein HON53_06580 [Planctomycetaceae bacterium]|jgi:hypothetical protein|nr:hypothetical protein [Planctomycetaceae bacterium]MBT6156957.1 hypothetical protein [Planctomycetaceae bacterium]MBT6484474.1 hypothetical protein [Planctomycetaceae bacterium]MBT6498148.1 hypothetical protein [Planctomycetaceae bacterium]